MMTKNTMYHRQLPDRPLWRLLARMNVRCLYSRGLNNNEAMWRQGDKDYTEWLFFVLCKKKDYLYIFLWGPGPDLNRTWTGPSGPGPLRSRSRSSTWWPGPRGPGSGPAKRLWTGPGPDFGQSSHLSVTLSMSMTSRIYTSNIFSLIHMGF